MLASQSLSTPSHASVAPGLMALLEWLCAQAGDADSTQYRHRVDAFAGKAFSGGERFDVFRIVESGPGLRQLEIGRAHV